MKNKFSYVLVAFAALALTFTSCKRDKNDITPDYSGTFASQSDDESRFSAETDAVTNDANTAIDGSPAISGGRIEGNGLCDATVSYDTTGGAKTITITYNGTSCDGKRHREGVVTLSLPAGVHWKDAGAVLTINISNLKITRLSDNKSITLNGTHVITNVSGGLVKNLASTGTITHTISSNNMSVTFDNGSQRTWQVSKQRVFTYDNGIVITTTGTYNDGTNNDIAEWGTNRFGNAFASRITSAMIVRQDCNFRLTSGQITHEKLDKTIVVTFGLDSSGSPTSCPGSGNYYFKAAWTDAKGNAKSVILPY